MSFKKFCFQHSFELSSRNLLWPLCFLIVLSINVFYQSDKARVFLLWAELQQSCPRYQGFVAAMISLLMTLIHVSIRSWSGNLFEVPATQVREEWGERDWKGLQLPTWSGPALQKRQSISSVQQQCPWRKWHRLHLFQFPRRSNPMGLLVLVFVSFWLFMATWYMTCWFFRSIIKPFVFFKHMPFPQSWLLSLFPSIIAAS